MLRPLLTGPIVAGILFALLLTACSVPPPTGFQNTPLQVIGELDAGAPFAGSAASDRIAWGQDGLRLQTLDNTEPQLVDAVTPVDLAWSRDGRLLAAVFSAEPASVRLVLYDRSGRRLREELLAVELLTLRWSRRGDLLVGGYRLSDYSFGSNLALKLFVFTSIKEPPLEIVLGDTTLKPGSAVRLADQFPDILEIAFSAAGDELVYTRLHDPPEFDPYLQVVARHWQVPIERTLTRIPVGPVRLTMDAEQGLFRLGREDSDGEWLRLWEEPGSGDDRQPAKNNSAVPYRLVNGRLYMKDRLLIEWPADSRLQALPDGAFLLATGGRLYLGKGLQGYEISKFDAQDWMLRRWLYQGLITREEYRRTRTRTLP